jgi:hypothetical protein
VCSPSPFSAPMHARVKLLGVNRTEVFHALPLPPVGRPGGADPEDARPRSRPGGNALKIALD